MAAARSLSLMRRRCVPVNTAPQRWAAAANSTGPRSGQADRSSIKKRCSMYFAVENNKGLFKGSGSDDVLREKFARQLKWCTDVMDVFAP